MSAEILREAASKMRERAEAATGGTWSSGGVWWENWTDPEGRLCHTPWPTITTGTLGSEIVGKVTTEADADYFASIHPAVALAVADWLEVTADRVNTPAQATLPQRNAAIAVATAYLGSDR